ncbi:MAG: energy transducer TonB [Chlorobaculum sp.]|jgi:periplasmic protein TonB|nr:energy transducer TonB [Chlorobaculum sp.]
MKLLIRKLFIVSLIVPFHSIWNNISLAGNRYIVVEVIDCQNPPTVVRTPSLVYPETARILGLEGKVFVRVLIDEDGCPIKAEIAKRIPFDCSVFDYEAERIAMESTYTPGVLNGRKVRVWMTIPIRFTLHEGGYPDLSG